jgi:hypothetical protein
MITQIRNILRVLSISCAVIASVLLATKFGMAETGGHKIIALEFRAYDYAEVLPEIIDPTTGEAIPNTENVLCFDGLIFDAASGREIGTATDCLKPTYLDDGGTPGDSSDDSLQIIGTTIFELPAGTIISQGKTSVRPVTWPSESQPNTHITGAIPFDDENSIMATTGRYKNSTGTVRLSGAVDMTDFVTETGLGQLDFTCLFIITLD